MLPLDGSELCFVFLYGFLVDIWTHNVLIAPSSMAIVQYAIPWPIYLYEPPSQAEVLGYHIGQAISVWAGSSMGSLVRGMWRCEKLLYWNPRRKRSMAIGFMFLCGVIASPCAYVGTRVVTDSPWPTTLALIIAIVVYGTLLRTEASNNNSDTP